MRNTIQKKTKFHESNNKTEHWRCYCTSFCILFWSYSTSSRSKPLKRMKQVFTQQVPFWSASRQHQVGWLRFNSAFNTN